MSLIVLIESPVAQQNDGRSPLAQRITRRFAKRTMLWRAPGAQCARLRRGRDLAWPSLHAKKLNGLSPDEALSRSVPPATDSATAR